MITDEKTETLSNGNTFVYAISDFGTAFTKARKLKEDTDFTDYTDEKLWNVLDSAIRNKFRVRVWYGDKKTGRSWNEEWGVTGRIGRSCGGELHIPIMVQTSRSLGGGSLLENCILRVDRICDRRTLYQVENFHTGDYFIKDNSGSDYRYEVWNVQDDGTSVNVANFHKHSSAYRYIEYMRGERYAK